MIDAKYYAATQVMDEARHVEVYAKYLREKLGEEFPINLHLRSLLDSGEVRPDQIGVGVEVDGTCRAGEHLWAMGPLTKGHYWEIIAVPDIRDQAAAIADDIQRELGE